MARTSSRPSGFIGSSVTRRARSSSPIRRASRGPTSSPRYVSAMTTGCAAWLCARWNRRSSVASSHQCTSSTARQTGCVRASSVIVRASAWNSRRLSVSGSLVGLGVVAGSSGCSSGKSVTSSDAAGARLEPRIVKKPARRASSTMARRSRDLPTPASPMMSATCPAPARARSSTVRTASISASRPTIVGQTTSCRRCMRGGCTGWGAPSMGTR